MTDKTDDKKPKKVLEKYKHTLYCSHCTTIFDYPAVCTTPMGKRINVCPLCSNTKLVKWKQGQKKYKSKKSDRRDRPRGLKQFLQSKIDRLPFYRGWGK